MLETLNCNSCGAPLEVPDTAKFVHCNHCNTNLEVQRTSGATFTSAVDRLAQTTEDLADRVEELSRHSEVEALDRQWESEQRAYMIRGRDGHSHLPSEGSMFGSIAAGVFGVLWTIFAIALTQSAPSHGPFVVAKIFFPLFGLVFVCVAIFGGLHGRQRAQDYRRAERDYRRRRDELMRDD